LSKKGTLSPPSPNESVGSPSLGERDVRVRSSEAANRTPGVEAALERIRGVLGEEPESIFWKDVDSVYLGCNERFARDAGLGSPAEVVGKTDRDLPCTDSEADFYREVDRRIIATDSPEYHIIEPQLRADGRRVWLDASKTPFYDEAGLVAGVVGVCSDITGRVESEKVLAHGTQVFRAMSFTARAMIEHGDWTTNINTVLAALGEAIEASRVTMFSIHEGDDDHLLKHRFEWVAAGFESRQGDPALEAVPMQKIGLARLHRELVAGRCVHARVSELSPEERRILEVQDVLSVAVSPIFVEHDLWGFLEFQDSTTERQWLIAEIEALRSAAGIVGAAIQRHRVERALRLETRRFGQLFENTPLAILMSDADENVLAVNPAFEALFGFSRTDVIGRQINDLITPPDRFEEASRLSRRTMDGETVGHRTVRLRRDGSEVPVQVFGVPVSQGGEIVQVYGIYVDQTERLRAEAALRESEEKFRSLAEQSLQGIFVVVNRRVVYANGMMAEITGYGLDEILEFDQDRLEAIIHPSDRSFVVAAADRFEIGDGRVSPSSEYRLITKTGMVKWVLQQTRTVRFDGELGVEGVLVDITQRKRAEEQLLHSALHDPLTGLPNRASFHDRVQLALERAHGRADSPFAVIFLDLDRFKLINDGYGHQAGDRLLVEIAHRLRRAVRPGDTVARLGGDEFTVLIPDVGDQDEAVSVAQRIHDALAQPFRVGDEEVFTTASTGIALSSSRYDRPDEILRDADIAMYQAKAEGRARHFLYDESMHPLVLSQLHLENDLRRALERDEFLLHYQPIVSTSSGKIVACEALLRWQHPERGLLPPGEFLSLAEETGLINPIGEWVLRTGCRQATKWMRELKHNGSPAVSINLFSRQFSRAELVSFIERELAENELPADRLQLEITESAVIDVPELAIDVMRRLRALGVKVHLDDFGTGYSSLAYLQRFAVDTLKIDRGFIQRLGSDSDGAEIVRTIITLARNLGMEALAEGIERPEQLSLAREMGCDFAQGYLFSKPRPPSEISTLLAKGPMDLCDS
jgi:diguanylate cyclase (GGDEF)-like protein/PAS domain S-box-containing protein